MATVNRNTKPLLNLVLQTSTEAFLLLDSQGTILGLSRPLAECLGYAPEELAGKPFHVLAPEDLNPPPLDPPPEGEREFTILNGSGENIPTRWLIVSMDIQAQESGKKYLAAYLKKIVSQHEAGYEPYIDNTLCSHIYDNLPVGLLVTDLQGRIVLYNRTQENITGILRKDALGGVLFKDYAAQAPQEAIASFEQALHQKVESSEHEFDYTDRFGNTRRFKTCISSLLGPDDKIHGVIQTLEDVSRPRLLEQEINRTKDLLKRLLDSTPNTIITSDPTGKVTFYNRAADSLLGLDSLEEIRIGQLFIGGEREAKQVMAYLEERSGTIENYETYFLDAQGNEVPVSLTLSFIYDEEAKPAGTVSIVRNLSLEKKLESEFRKNEHYLAVFIQNSPDAVITLDESWRVLTWNQGAEKIFGYTCQEMVGENLNRLITTDAPSHVISGMNHLRTFRDGELKHYITELVNSQGQKLVVEATSTVIKEQDGRLTGRLLIFRDVSERARLEKSLQEHISDLYVINEISEALLTPMDLNEILGIILIGVTAAQGLGFNRAFLLLYDHQEEALMGKLAIGPSNAEEAGIIWTELNRKHQTLSDLLQAYKHSIRDQNIYVNEIVSKIKIPLSEADNPLVRCFREKRSLNVASGVAAGQFPRSLAELLGTETMAIMPMVCEDRSVGLLLADNLINRKPIEDESIRKLRVFANLASQTIERSRLYLSLEEKIDDLDKAYQELKESRDKLVRAERLSAVGEVAAHVAHEIRNPLVCIGGFARSLFKELKEKDPIRNKVQIILDEVERLERYLKDTLTFIRPYVPEFHPTDPTVLVHETFQMLDSEIDGSKVEIDLALMENPPQIEIDPDQIRQVLLNIFRNALEAMPGGGRLTVSSNSKNGFFTISVADTGMGIDKQNMENLFTAFFTTKTTGSGLGLTISSQIINNHGGTIGLSSERGVGTVFHITLPIKQAAAKE
ncbi:MAG TPA: PAS domain S-box protein [archaeon]|nr:PAS domain S-box protein [archaeon]